MTDAETELARRRQVMRDTRQAVFRIAELLMELGGDLQEQEAMAMTAVRTDGESESPIGTEAKSAAVRTDGDRSALLTVIVLHLSQVRTRAPSVLAQRFGCSVDKILDLVRTSNSLCITDFGEVGFASDEATIAAQSPLPLLSDSDHRAMVGAVGLFLDQWTHGTLDQLAQYAGVTRDQVKRYVVNAAHLILDHCGLVRRAAPVTEWKP